MKFFRILLALSMPFIVFVQAQQVQSDEIPFEHKKELALEIINAELNIRGPQGGQIPEVVDIHPIVGGKENSEDHIRRLEALKAYIKEERGEFHITPLFNIELDNLSREDQGKYFNSYEFTITGAAVGAGKFSEKYPEDIKENAFSILEKSYDIYPLYMLVEMYGWDAHVIGQKNKTYRQDHEEWQAKKQRILDNRNNQDIIWEIFREEEPYLHSTVERALERRKMMDKILKEREENKKQSFLPTIKEDLHKINDFSNLSRGCPI